MNTKGRQLRLGPFQRIERLLAATTGNEGREDFRHGQQCVMVWKNDGLSVATRMVAAAIWASGETCESVSATTGTPRPAA